MAQRDFIPGREAELLTWATAFASHIVADPTSFGLTAAQATTFDDATSAYRTALQRSSNPNTRTPTSIVAKREAKKALVQLARELARLVRATPGVTNAQKSDLGLTIADDEPTPIGRPGEAPLVHVRSVQGCTVWLRLRNAASPRRRARPIGVAGATLFSWTGDVPPVDLRDWRFEGNTARTKVAISFPSVQPGVKVWLAAQWFNPRFEPGPMSRAVMTTTQFSGPVFLGRVGGLNSSGASGLRLAA